MRNKGDRIWPGIFYEFPKPFLILCFFIYVFQNAFLSYFISPLQSCLMFSYFTCCISPALTSLPMRSFLNVYSWHFRLWSEAILFFPSLSGSAEGVLPHREIFPRRGHITGLRVMEKFHSFECFCLCEDTFKYFIASLLTNQICIMNVVQG